ncbi:DUF222 domain-containing protein [Rhodococcoides fascians]|uniref:DUF222 domain-containing protein n=1 Tax=Rhodococcoides fascians TaxID=1828 RepID=UPI001F4C77D4|nr:MULTISPECIES: DUF222 domain-containing protein [Rhodococcus]
MIERGVEEVGRMQTAGLDNADRRALLVRMEVVRHKLFAYSHTWIADLVDQRGLDDIYGSVPEALSVLLRSSGSRAGQRIRLAMEFGERTSITGERLEPLSPNTLRGAEDGLINEEHQQIIRKFFWRLGSKVDIETREKAEAQLAELARQLSPDHLKAAASRLYDLIDPDGDDEDPARVADRCYVQFDEQGADGLSRGKMVVDSELRAYIEAVFDKWAKPGQANPADPPPSSTHLMTRIVVTIDLISRASRQTPRTTASPPRANRSMKRRQRGRVEIIEAKGDGSTTR